VRRQASRLGTMRARVLRVGETSMDATVARGARECPALPRCGGRRRHARFERSSNGLLQIVDPWSREKSRAGGGRTSRSYVHDDSFLINAREWSLTTSEGSAKRASARGGGASSIRNTRNGRASVKSSGTNGTNRKDRPRTGTASGLATQRSPSRSGREIEPGLKRTRTSGTPTT